MLPYWLEAEISAAEVRVIQLTVARDNTSDAAHRSELNHQLASKRSMLARLYWTARRTEVAA